MEFASLQKHFGRMGARVAVTRRPGGFTVDIRRDPLGSLFDVAVNGATEQVMALDVQPRQRHLLLVVRHGATHKYLCGHDERDWFAAAVPNAGGVSNVREAMEALKPSEVREAQLAKRVKRQHLNRRRNAGFVRQGEWFFVPVTGLVVKPLLVIHNEPLIRGRGKPHVAESVYRTGGQMVFVSSEYPRGLSEKRYRRLLIDDPSKAHLRWSVVRLNPEAYVRGAVRHPDHKTIRLDEWHRVFTNTENRAPAMRHLVFID
jgi:hypothetical protein